MKKKILTALFACCMLAATAQDKPARAITMEEYEKAKKFTVKDLDNDT